MNPPRFRRRSPGRRREQVLDAANALFAQRAYEEVSIKDIADPVRRVVTDLVLRGGALLAAFHADIADDSPRLRHALACWTGLNRAATRHWLRGEASREATHELLASTLEHVLRTFGAPGRKVQGS